MTSNDDILPTTGKEDPWQSLKAFTNARIAIGRAGNSIPLKESLRFKMAHSEARDAVYGSLDIPVLTNGLIDIGLPFFRVRSMAKNRNVYLQRPDLGRQLDPGSIKEQEEGLFQPGDAGFDLAIIIADGLSAKAINHHAIPVLHLLIPELHKAGIRVAPVCIAEQARVAIGDPVGQLLKAAISLVFIGERPGLSSPDSMGAYLTYQPMPGKTDAFRNCVSNIRPEGLNYGDATSKLLYLLLTSHRLKTSGVHLKEKSSPGFLP